MSRLAGFRLIPRLETYPSVVSLAQTAPGKLVVLALFCLGMRFFLADFGAALELAVLVALITFMPEYRRFILAATPIVFVIGQSYREPLLLGLNLSVIGLGILLYGCAMQWPNSLFGRRPITFLLAGLTALILFACAATPHSLVYTILWNLTGLTASYVWFVGYALIDRNSKPAKDLTLELATFRPLWGSTYVPFPKGAAYLRRIEAKNAEQLAIFQLKGLKLLVWAILLSLLFRLWNQ